MSVGEYLTRVRLRTFIEHVRKPSASAIRAAEDAGYASYHNVVDALRRRTGLGPTEIRGLSQDSLRDVLDVNLPLDRTGHHDSRRGRPGASRGSLSTTQPRES